MDTGDIDLEELQRRVLRALGQPLVRLARVFGTPLQATLAGLRLSYFHHLKGTGSTLREIADVEREHSLPVRIELMLWATPMSRAAPQAGAR